MNESVFAKPVATSRSSTDCSNDLLNKLYTMPVVVTMAIKRIASTAIVMRWPIPAVPHTLPCLPIIEHLNYFEYLVQLQTMPRFKHVLIFLHSLFVVADVLPAFSTRMIL